LFLLPFALLQASAFVVQPNSRSLPVKSTHTLNLSSRTNDDVMDISARMSTLTSDDADAESLRQYSVEIQQAVQTSPLKQFSEGYSTLTKEHYYPMAFAQAAFLASFADVSTQSLEHADLNIGHVAAMAAVASSFSGAINANWLRQLEEAFPGKQPKEVAYKTLIHAFLSAGIINSAYLIGVPLFTDFFFSSGGFTLPPMDFDVLRGHWTIPEFIILTKLELLMFVPYNVVAFKFISPSIRPLTHAAVSATFNVAVSAVTLGYFDIWCQRAMSMLS
jgi:hypothetical protein